ncbi:MAG: hypothetical protein KJN76_05495 [Eudoraea sp.]|nr:hypothetical protein [Eudoraea sp.]
MKGIHTACRLADVIVLGNNIEGAVLLEIKERIKERFLPVCRKSYRYNLSHLWHAL